MPNKMDKRTLARTKTHTEAHWIYISSIAVYGDQLIAVL